MIDSFPVQNHHYPHQKGEVTDQDLKLDTEEHPEAYGLMLPYIDTYLSKKNGVESNAIENGDAFVVGTLEAIEAMQADVASEIGASPNSQNAVAATDYLLKRELEESIRSGEQTDERAALAPFVAGALEADGQRDSSETNLVVALEEDGFENVVTASIAELHRIDAHLPVTGHDASEILIQGLEAAKGDRVIVGNPELQSAIDTLSDAELLLDDSATYHQMLTRFGDIAITVDWQDTPRKDLEAFISRLAKLDASEKSKEENDGSHQVSLKTLAFIVPAETLKQLYLAQEDEPSVIHEALGNVTLDSDTIPLIVGTLLKIYGSRKELLNLPVGADVLVDKLRDSEYKADFAINLLEPKPEDPKNPESLTEHDHSMITQARDILENKLGLPHSFVEKYGIAIYGRLLSPPESMRELGYINGANLAKRLNRVKESVKAVGPEAIVRLHEQLGLVNIDNYISEDLQNLTKLLDEDQEYIRQLQGGDVTVVFADAYGDHNGALSQSFDAYRKDNGRTLMFEISSPSDLYRRMIMLKNLGVKPSTLAVSAHGQPGGTNFGNKINGEFGVVSSEVARPLYKNTQTINLSEARLDRLTGDEFMQVSKGLDDGRSITGRRRIIINSCSSDVEFNNGVPSTAEAVARTAGRDDVDVYGASDVMYMQDKNGDISFLGKSDKNSKVATEEIGQKISIRNRNGFVTRLREKLGVGSMITANGRRLDKRRNGALRIKRTRVDKVFSRNTNTFQERAA